MRQRNIPVDSPEERKVLVNLRVPFPIWEAAKVPAARTNRTRREFAIAAIGFYAEHVEEEYRQEIILAAAKRKAS